MAVFYVMNFTPHYDKTRGGIGWLELSDQKEYKLDELLVGTAFEIRDFVAKAKPGEYRWFGVEMYVVRVR